MVAMARCGYFCGALLVLCMVVANGAESRVRRKRTGVLRQSVQKPRQGGAQPTGFVQEDRENLENRVGEGLEAARRAQSTLEGNNPQKQLGLLEKRWNWKQATDESKVEWGIVMKRYFMVNMLITDLVRDFGRVLEQDPNTMLVNDQEDRAKALPWVQAKFNKLASSVKHAETDQETDNVNFKRMQKDKVLTDVQKKALLQEHDREEKGAAALDKDVNVVVKHASALVEAAAAASKKQHPDKTEEGKMGKMYTEFRDVAGKFEENYQTFEDAQKKALAQLLAMKFLVERKPAPVEKKL